MKEYLLIGFFMTLFLVTIIVCNFFQTASHEQAHYLFNKYNGAESTVTLNYLGQSYTTVDSNFPSQEARDLAYEGHMMNEAIAYNLTPMFNMIAAIFIIGFNFLGVIICLK